MPGERPPAGDPADAAPTRWVDCVRLGQRLPGLPRPPLPGPLGQRIYAQVSQQAWTEWLEHSRRLINEHSLKLSDPQARAFLQEQCEAFLFEGRTAPPSGWVPEQGAVRLVTPKPAAQKPPEPDDAPSDPREPR